MRIDFSVTLMLIDMRRFKEMMEKFRLDAIACMSPENVYYLSGYSPLEPRNTFSTVITAKDHDPILLTACSDIGSVIFSEC